jgi:hypothetical protein
MRKVKKHIETRLIEQLKAKGFADGPARGLARKKMVEAGNVTKDGQLTDKGKERSAMGAAGRAKDRQARYTGRDAEDFTYNHLKNTARVKKDR